MIYVTGDCHSDFRRFSTPNFPEQKEMTKDDLVIICGDFGGVWDYRGETKYEQYWLKWLEERPFTTLFVSGNHENFDRLSEYPEEKWHGGCVHKIRPSVLHLMRGEIYEIEGKSFFAFGGARSHDIRDGILDPVKDEKKIREWSKKYDKLFRINQRTWWKQEEATKEEMEYGRKKLKEHGNRVDYIISHCGPQNVINDYSGGCYKPEPMTQYFNEIAQMVDFQAWFFGHYHDNKQILDKYYLLYEQIIRIL